MTAWANELHRLVLAQAVRPRESSVVFGRDSFPPVVRDIFKCVMPLCGVHGEREWPDTITCELFSGSTGYVSFSFIEFISPKHMQSGLSSKRLKYGTTPHARHCVSGLELHERSA
jgi:hypothetical protein